MFRGDFGLSPINKWRMFFLMLIPFVSCTAQKDLTYGNQLAELPLDIAKLLAEKDAPNKDGAMGRNKSTYFHVRFQLGLHNLVGFGLAAKNENALDYFLKAVEYSFQHQLTSGGFKLEIPRRYEGQGSPSESDLASGVAFFAASLGSGWYAINTNRWAQKSTQLEPMRHRLDGLKPQLKLTLDYLKSELEVLKLKDQHAPNRLLFDAVAFYTLGKLVVDDEALDMADELIGLATNQVDEAGYYIEGGGFDSSYNGVATALSFRLLLMGFSGHDLDKVAVKAMAWQVSRINDQGQISTSGNSRVNHSINGESFLGRKKDVDVGHTIEALMLSSLLLRQNGNLEIAKNVVKYYQEK